MNKQILITILVITGILTTIHSVSALTENEKFHQGVIDAISRDNDIKDKSMFILTTAFQLHSDAYRNGYIAEIDAQYHLKIPYVQIETQELHYIPTELNNTKPVEENDDVTR